MTFYQLKSVVHDINQYDQFLVTFPSGDTCSVKAVKAGKGLLLSGLLVFERDFASNKSSGTKMIFAEKVQTETNGATYTIHLKDGMDFDFNQHTDAAITIEATKSNFNRIANHFSCIATNEQLGDLDYLLANLGVYEESVVEQKLNCLSMEDLGELSTNQKRAVRSFMEDFLGRDVDEEKTFCVFKGGDGLRRFGVYGIDSKRVLGSVMI